MAGRRGAGFWIRLAWAVIYPLDTLLFRLRWRGLDNVPKTGGVLLAVNHISYVDPLIIARWVWDAGRVPRFLIKDGLFRVFFVGSVLKGAKQIPVHRGMSDAQASLRDAVVTVERGECVVIYPEGTVTRDPDWWPMLARTGVARLALAADAPVVPVAQWGPQYAVDVYNKRFRPFPRKTVTVVAGPPIDLSAYRGRPLTADLLREVTDLIMGRIRDLQGEVRGETPPAAFWRRAEAKAVPAGEPADPAPRAASAAAADTVDAPDAPDQAVS